MKKLFLLLSLLLITAAVAAQSEVLPTDSIQRMPTRDVKNFGGFLLDMSLAKVTAPQLSKYTFDLPDASKDYSSLFRLDPNVTYTQGFTTPFSTSALPGIGYGWGLYSSSQYMQTGSFRLKNGMRFVLSGDYNADGWKVPNRSAMPWEKDNFRGAFELKSANGNFGIRFEVQQRRKSFF